MTTAYKTPGTKGAGWTGAEGELLELPERTIVDMLGTNYSGGLRGNAKSATWSQVLMHAGWGWPGQVGIPMPDTIFTQDEILSIVECIMKKTGRIYYLPKITGSSQYGPGCGSCSCIP
jgi:hypothetical protein